MTNTAFNTSADTSQPQSSMLPEPVATASVPSVSTPPDPQPVMAPPQHVQPSLGMTAEDVDLIEKMWVQKAKAIVQATVNDPREQARLLGEMKAEYVQKRFGKELGTGK